MLINALLNQIVPLIQQVTEEIERSDQHPVLMLRYFYLLGRIEFLNGNYEEAQGAFGECNMMVSGGRFSDTHLYFYWIGRIRKIEGEFDLANYCFQSALFRFNDASVDVTKDDIIKELNSVK